MNSLRIDIINPKAIKLLRDLEYLDLISIQDESHLGFIKVLNRIRAKAITNLSLKEITREVEIVRSKRYKN